MTSPIEKLRARSEAFRLLGVSEGAAPGEIRAAWRRIAFEVHPDRAGGDYGAFMRAKAAYDLLRLDPEASRAWEEAGGRGFRTGAARPAGARPRVTTRHEPLSPEAVAACRELLAEAREGGAGQGGGAGGWHVPTAVRRHGRSLTYVVPTALRAGLNRIALPTAVLEDHRRVRPGLLTVRAAQSGSGEVRIPDRQRERMFPGARSVHIRFGEV